MEIVEIGKVKIEMMKMGIEIGTNAKIDEIYCSIKKGLRLVISNVLAYTAVRVQYPKNSLIGTCAPVSQPPIHRIHKRNWRWCCKETSKKVHHSCSQLFRSFCRLPFFCCSWVKLTLTFDSDITYSQTSSSTYLLIRLLLLLLHQLSLCTIDFNINITPPATVLQCEGVPQPCLRHSPFDLVFYFSISIPSSASASASAPLETCKQTLVVFHTFYDS